MEHLSRQHRIMETRCHPERRRGMHRIVSWFVSAHHDTFFSSCINFSLTFLAFLWVTLPAVAFADSSSSAGSATAKPIKLLEPLPGGLTEIKGACAANPFSILNTYLNPLMTWGIGIAAGISVLMIIIGGFQIMLSGGDQSAIQNGKDRIKSALLGLLLLVISGTILNLLNAFFFKLNPGAPSGC